MFRIITFSVRVLIPLVLSAPTIFSARILGVVPMPSYSHQVAFHSLWRELTLRGHQVTVITTHPIQDPSLQNLTEIDICEVGKQLQKLEGLLTPNDFANVSVIESLSLINKFSHDIIDAEMQHPEVQKLLINKDEDFDVALVETAFPGMAALAERYKCPLIQIFSADASTVNYYSIGNPSHPVLNPDRMLPLSGKLNFFERVLSTLYVPMSLFYYKYLMLSAQDLIIKKYFGNDMPPLEEILKNTSLVFINTDNVFHPLRPLLPNVIQIGGGTHLKPPIPLPKKIQTVLDNAKNGVVYFSLGSNVKSSLLSESIRKIFLETFAELPYTVLWKFELEDLPGKSENVFVSKWFPQQDIFRHSNVKLFISQGGLQSMDEAVHNHIPIIGIPFYGDQDKNVKRMVDQGIGLGLNRKTISKSVLKEAIYEVMNNSKYHEKVKYLAELSKDQPMTGLERAVWWTEYVIRHKGAKHLKSPAIDLPDYQYYLLDILGFCLGVLLITIYLLVQLIILIVRLINYLLPKSKVKIE